MPESAEATAPGIQAMCGAAGACPVVRWRGKSYKVGHPTQAAKARLEELAADTAIARVEAKAGKVKPATLETMLARVCDRVAADDYATWAAGWQEVVWADGGALFLLSLLHEHHPDLTVADAKAMKDECDAQYRAALARVLPGFIDLLLANKSLPPEQEEAVRAGVATFAAKLTPPQPPTPATDSPG